MAHSLGLGITKSNWFFKVIYSLVKVMAMQYISVTTGMTVGDNLDQRPS